MKKTYRKPGMKAIEINTQRTVLLTASNSPQAESIELYGDWD